MLYGSSLSNAGDSTGFRHSCYTRADSWSDHVSTRTVLEIMNHFADSHHFSPAQDKTFVHSSYPRCLTGSNKLHGIAWPFGKICLFVFLPRV